MTPVDFPERNDEVVVLNKSVGAFRDGTTVTTVWALSPEEMLEVIRFEKRRPAKHNSRQSGF